MFNLEPLTGTHIIVCHTPECLNVGTSIVLELPESFIYCAGCSQLITDIIPPLPIGGYPPDVDIHTVDV